MTPKEKARDIFNKMQMDFIYFASKEISKRNAIIAVDEILNECTYWALGINIDWENDRFKFWQEVKHEIKKL